MHGFVLAVVEASNHVQNLFITISVLRVRLSTLRVLGSVLRLV